MSRTFDQDTWDLVDLENEDGQISSGAAGPCLVVLVHAPAVRQAYVIHLSPIYAYQWPEQLRDCLDTAARTLPKEVEVWIGGCERSDAADHKALRADVSAKYTPAGRPPESKLTGSILRTPLSSSSSMSRATRSDPFAARCLRVAVRRLPVCLAECADGSTALRVPVIVSRPHEPKLHSSEPTIA